jgi:heme a synthase
LAKNNRKSYHYLALFAALLAFTVVILGAYTRLKDAGLGCPDWPGCYGHFFVPEAKNTLAAMQKAYPNQPIDSTKAWAEMTHRYFAGALSLLIFGLAAWSVSCRKKRALQQVYSQPWGFQFGTTKYPRLVPVLLVGCIIFQAILGMWTVTWQLLPLVVMGHLLGGMTITALLWWLTLATGIQSSSPQPSELKFRPWVVLGLAIVFLQIFLGGWTSANYASIICPEFPYCQGHLFPTMDFQQAFNFLSPIGQNYQGGVLGTTARVTIQMTHRYGAFITVAYIGSLAWYLLFSKNTNSLKNTAGMILLILLTQFTLGILNIETSLSLSIAVMHNAVALLLLLAMVTLLYQLQGEPAHATFKTPNLVMQRY